MELSLNLYNKGLEKMRGRELHIDFDPSFIDSLLSVTMLDGQSSRDPLTLRPIVNTTSRFNVTLSDLDGRKTKKLVFILRSNRTDIFNAKKSESVLKIQYKELKTDRFHRELEIFSDLFKPA